MHSQIALKRAALFALLTIFAIGPAFAEKPSWAGSDGGNGHAKGKSASGPSKSKSDSKDSGGITFNAYFGDRHNTIVSDYYRSEFRSGSCPPGLAKKQNGCMPPGQAKKWSVGRALPNDVIIYDLPSALVLRLGAPPAGHRYVRVAADILLIAVGTNMVIDAIQDLSAI